MTQSPDDIFRDYVKCVGCCKLILNQKARQIIATQVKQKNGALIIRYYHDAKCYKKRKRSKKEVVIKTGNLKGYAPI